VSSIFITTSARRRHSLVVQARDAGAYTQMDDYVRGLEYGARHHDWGLGS
jgi:hypothetical protein